MKNGILFLNFIFLLLTLMGCNLSVNYSFLQDMSNIDNIKIVEVGDLKKDEKIPEIKVIVVIEDQRAFLDEFVELECQKLFDDPTGVCVGDTAIKIEYKNGDYELISENGQAEYCYSEYYEGMFYNQHTGWYYFDREEIQAFINKWDGDDL